MMFRSAVKQLLHRVGYDMVRLRQVDLLHRHGIDLVFDVGANTGQYATGVRRSGYKGRLVSFEPLATAFDQLERRAGRDPRWEVVHTALGHRNGGAKLNVAGNSVSSSLLDMLPRTVSAAPDATYVGTQEITVRTLDSVFDEYHEDGERAYLKIDAQGYERNIVEGACRSLGKIIGIRMEMSLVPLYEGEVLFADMIKYMSEKGYPLTWVEPGFTDPSTGQLLQVDGMFFADAR